MKKQEQVYPVLFWHATVDPSNEDITYHLDFEGDKGDFNEEEATDAMRNAMFMKYPLVCIN